MRRRAAVKVSLVLAVFVLVPAAVAGWVSEAEARPDLVEIVLNPDADTYLGLGVSRGQDDSDVLHAGWVYAARPKEYRANLSFPLEPERMPVEYLRRAELSLYAQEPPDTSQLWAKLRVRRMKEPLTPGRTAPVWFEADDPTIEKTLETGSDGWKTVVVTDIVREMLDDGEELYGFEVAGSAPEDNTRWKFISLEGGEPAPGGRQPQLVLQFDDRAFPSPTPDWTRTPKPTVTPSPTNTSAATATPVATATPTEVPLRAIFIPAAER